MGQGTFSAERRTWAVLLYMGWGVNELFEQDQQDVLDEIEAAEFTHVEVVYQFARQNRVERGSIRNKKRRILSTSPPIDITDPGHVTRFLDWAGEAFPARYTAFFAKDHGQGSIDRQRPETVLTASGIFLNPEGRYMPMASFRRSIEHSRAGRVDVLGLDVCRVGSVEVAYELREAASCLIVSESTESTTGWAYPAVMKYLDVEGDLATPHGLVRKVVEASTTFSIIAVELAWIERVAKALDVLGKELGKVLAHEQPKLLAWIESSFAQLYSDGVPIDMLVTLLTDKGLCEQTTLNDITKTLERALLRSDAHGGKQPGFGLFFPTTKGSPSIANYGAGKFAADFCWAEFLGALNQSLLKQSTG